jgi:hypothetical protein
MALKGSKENMDYTDEEKNKMGICSNCGDIAPLDINNLCDNCEKGNL